MKKLITFTAAMLVLIMLVSCEGNISPISDGSGEESTEKYEFISTSQTTYDVGDFSVYVPEGWEAVPQKDVEDNEITLKNMIMLAKGPTFDENTGKLDSSECQKFYIAYCGSDSLDKLPSDKTKWSKTKDAENLQIGVYTWNGFIVEKNDAEMAVIWTTVGDHGYRLTADLIYGLTLSDPDLKTAIESLK